ncbi:DUF4225 domain-containing protein [Photorhabdus laumondii subsp. laumondii]|uniref:Photorhabdus luminescens subsp. laumondii TTO1 complete genome segment 11/17 n=2 Tax=Photorhabdus laumondii subsp. laumondii TaxID=141679 RepID=Q7N2C9_PHOLL|nr:MULTISPECIES: DUF4225 domain-containing protein [Photorhabdus]AXG43627.1 DUF4225 domain-containing protein [Photorhabdus laumondii subsp. laumondii]AXG48170.1 DUF4225 domain-containing protein [Photorhabdus laumondii subsp. laumondii]MCC8386188.1 DUF4225 domain-containing protein [Photorhabdus laumondii]MCC8390524.1 DUF4225 domain-containing protein [Photorhabdus laumondii]MCC8415236.1 DUF4225 domain-containing protein [Photorhabdus laumondii]
MVFSSRQSWHYLEPKIQELHEISSKLNFRYLSDVRSGSRFLFEINELIRTVNHEIGTNCLSADGGIAILQDEIDNLKRQEFDLLMNDSQIYMIVQKEEEDEKTNLTLKRIGFVSGGSQIFAGLGVCVASLGAACAGFGVPLLIQGGNNVYENGYYLLLRKEVSGPVRDVYRDAAKTLGYSETDGDRVYGYVDLALSGYGMARSVVRPGTFRLFRYIKTDYIRGWQVMGRIPLIAELIGDMVTGLSIYSISEGEKHE